MGKAGRPYARTVQQMHALPRNMLPDAGLVFDTLLKREKVEALSTGIHIRPLMCLASVRQAPGWTVQHDVFIRSACHTYVSF
jgi:hypothetical protein